MAMLSSLKRLQLILSVLMYTVLSSTRLARSFVLPICQRGVGARLWASSLPEIASMRAGEIKKELESYGINTKKFLEKSEVGYRIDVIAMRRGGVTKNCDELALMVH